MERSYSQEPKSARRSIKRSRRSILHFQVCLLPLLLSVHIIDPVRLPKSLRSRMIDHVPLSRPILRILAHCCLRTLAAIPISCFFQLKQLSRLRALHGVLSETHQRVLPQLRCEIGLLDLGVLIDGEHERYRALVDMIPMGWTCSACCMLERLVLERGDQMA